MALASTNLELNAVLTSENAATHKLLEFTASITSLSRIGPRFIGGMMRFKGPLVFLRQGFTAALALQKHRSVQVEGESLLSL